MDFGRKMDLQELHDEYRRSETSTRKAYIKRIINKVMNESGATASAREKIMRAVRVNDHRVINYYSELLRRKEMQDTNGLGWQKRLRPSL